MVITLGACIAPAIKAPITQYIVVRQDLPRGVIAAQVAHAAGAGSGRHPPNTYVVVLSVPTETHLRNVYRELENRDIPATLVEESDLPYEGQATAIGIDLIRDRTELRKVVSNLPLYR